MDVKEQKERDDREKKIFVSRDLAQQLRYKYRGFAFIWFLLMLVILFLPGRSVPDVSWTIPHLDKVVHFTIFALLTFLLQRALTAKQFSRIILLLFLFAGGSEVIQELHIPYRSGDILDFIANSAGIIFAIIVTSPRFEGDAK